jgi:hypothetical protein
VHGHGAPFGGEGWQYRDSDRIIRFPDYDALKEAGVIPRDDRVQRQALPEEARTGRMEVDLEVLEILAEFHGMSRRRRTRWIEHGHQPGL